MNKIKATLLTLGFLAVSASQVLAENITIGKPNEVSVIQIGQIFSALVAIAIVVAGLLTFAYLVLGGIEWITSGGDKAGMEQARNRITNALIGLGIVVAAWAVTKVIETFFGITILGNTIKIPSVKDF